MFAENFARVRGRRAAGVRAAGPQVEPAGEGLDPVGPGRGLTAQATAAATEASTGAPSTPIVSARRR